MTTLNAFFATITTTTFRTIAILFTIGMIMTSCQKDSMEELDTSMQETAQLENSDQATTAINEKGISGQYIDEEAETTVFRSMASLLKARASRSTSRSSTLTIPEELGCGYSERHSTTNSTNELETSDNPCYNGSASFWGPDNHYFLTVTQQQTLSISISDLQADLDLFVFTLDSNGFPQSCKASSISDNTTPEEVTLTLNAGTYLVSVDGWRSTVKGSYELTVSCQQPPAPQSDCTDADLDWINNYNNLVECGAKIKLCRYKGRQVVDIDWRTCPIDFAGAIFECNGKRIEFYSRNDQKPFLTGCIDITPDTNDRCEDEDFSNYSLGKIASQSSKWRTWNIGREGTSQDATVVKTNSGRNILKVEDTNDVVYKLGDKLIGDNVLSTRIWVREGTEANLNIQKNFNESVPGGFYGIKFNKGTASISGALSTFDYEPNEWINIYMEFDMYRELTGLVLVQNGEIIGTKYIKYGEHPNVGGINFFGVNSQSEFYVDYVRLNCEGFGYFPN